MPSTTASPVVDAIWVAVITSFPAVRTAMTVAAAPLDPVNVLGVGAPVWPGRDVCEGLIVVVAATMLE